MYRWPRARCRYPLQVNEALLDAEAQCAQVGQARRVGRGHRLEQVAVQVTNVAPRFNNARNAGSNIIQNNLLYVVSKNNTFIIMQAYVFNRESHFQRELVLRHTRVSFNKARANIVHQRAPDEVKNYARTRTARSSSTRTAGLACASQNMPRRVSPAPPPWKQAAYSAHSLPLKASPALLLSTKKKTHAPQRPQCHRRHPQTRSKSCPSSTALTRFRCS